MKLLNAQVKKLFASIGIDVRLIANVKSARKRSWEDKWVGMWRFYSERDFRSIIDVGANTGQFARMIHRVFPRAAIFSFEPLRECFAVLSKNIESIPGAIAFQYALGEHEGTMTMQKSALSPSSSLLRMTDLHSRDWPESSVIMPEEVVMTSLDNFFSSRVLEGDILLKIDVQGYEDHVLKGGAQVLSRASVVLLEVSYVELYKGQPLFGDIHRIMESHGFIYKGNLEQHASTVDGQLLFADALYERNSCTGNKVQAGGAIG